MSRVMSRTNHVSATSAPLSLDAYLKKILTARVYDVAIESPLHIATRMSAALGHTVLLKREDQQPVFSFKLRGAYNKMAQLTPAQRARGVICASAGNHAQGVALAAAQLGCSARIVMPTTTPNVKIQAVKALGGQVDLFGESYNDAYNHARILQAEHGLTFVHPFDDPDVIAGQGTVAVEILRQAQLHSRAQPHAIFVPIGGGGLAAGIAAYVKAVAPEIRVIGVQMQDSAAMMLSVQRGERVLLHDVGLFSDGTAVKQVGDETYRLCQRYLDDYVVVDTDAVCAAIRDIFSDTRSIVEPAGAMAVAGLRQYVQARQSATGLTFAAVLSGANMNFERLRFVAGRSELGASNEALFAVTLAEARGSFLRFIETIAALPGGPHSVTEFNYRMNNAVHARVFVGLSISRGEQAQDIAARISASGFETVDLTRNELAKEHIRHLVGGPGFLCTDERLLRCEFPERPGALMRFLRAMQPNWNISLFHYRQDGMDIGHILVGVQVPSSDNLLFKQFLATLDYVWAEETDNPACQLFLRTR